MAERMLDLPYFTEAWEPENWGPMVPGCDCWPNPWADHRRDMLGAKCFKCRAEIRLVPEADQPGGEDG